HGVDAGALVVLHERALLHDLDRLFPARLAREELLERAERAEVARIERQHPAPRVDGVVDAAEDLALELAELRVQLDGLILVDLAGVLADLDDAVERLRQLVPRVRGLIERRQGAQRLEIARIEPIGAEPRIERAALAAELLAPHAAQ